MKTKKLAMFCTGGIRCEKASSYMLKKGFKNKDKVVCLLDNSYEQITLFFACLSLGVVWAPIEPKRKGIGLNYIISLVNPKAIFTTTKKNLAKKFYNKIILVQKNLKNILQPTNDYDLKFENNIKKLIFSQFKKYYIKLNYFF